MNALVSYEFECEPVRVVMVAGNPWFVASDLARALGYRESDRFTRWLHDDEKGTHIVGTLGGEQTMNIVSESGIYAAIFRSRRAEAERFRRWVTADVLPSIRRTGRYELPGHQPPPPSPLDHDTARLGAGVAAVREARRLFGPTGARSVWLQLGLPQPIVDAEGAHLGDPWAVPVRDWLAGRVETTATDVAQGVGIAPVDFSARRRIRAILQLFGWREANVRRDYQQVKRWLAPAATAIVEG